MENGTPVHQWDYVGISNQQWKIIDVGSGYSMIIARHSGKALDVEGGFTQNGTQVHQWDYVGIPNQQWKIRLRP
jgi:elongation factor Tu